MPEETRTASRARLYDAFAASGKALASGKRLELLDVLAQGERTVDALAKAAGLNLTTASAHLQILKQAGFVTTRREGVRIHYRLADDDVARLFALLRKVAEAHQPAVPPARDAYLGAVADAGLEGCPPIEAAWFGEKAPADALNEAAAEADAILAESAG